MKTKNALLTAVVLGSFVLPEAGHAFGVGDVIMKDVRTATRQTRDAVNTLRGSVEDGTERLIAALQRSAGENSAYMDKSIEATKRLMDAAQQNDTNRLRQEFRAQAESGAFDPDPGICFIAGLFGGSGGGGASVERGLGTKLSSSAAAKAAGEDPAVIAGGVDLARSLTDERNTYKEVLGIPDPTVDASILVIHPTIAVSSDPNAPAAIERLIRNLTDPTPPVPVTTEELRTPAGQARAAERAVQLTRTATAREAIAMVVNMRSEVGDVTDAWKAYVEDIAAYNRPVGEKMSELQGIDIRTLRYYAPSQDLLDERSTLTEKALLQQMIDQQSIANRIAYLQLELDSRRALVETQILSTLAN